MNLMTPYVTLYLCVSQMLEHQMEVREKEVQSLQSQALALAQEDSGIMEVDGQQRRVTDSFSKLQDPLRQRRQHLLDSKEAHQFNRDLEDEIVSHMQKLLHTVKKKKKVFKVIKEHNLHKNTFSVFLLSFFLNRLSKCVTSHFFWIV